MKLAAKNSRTNTRNQRLPKRIRKRANFDRPKTPSFTERLRLHEVLPRHSRENSNYSPRSLKPRNLDNRKFDLVEWKPLKKNDYQRLETVLEEVSNLRLDGDSDTEKSEGKHLQWNACDEKLTDSDYYNIVLLNKPNLKLFSDTETLSDDGQQQKEPTSERGDKSVAKWNSGVTKELKSDFAKDKRTDVMMEILPIFSNEKFVCSRDAISVGDGDDFESLEKIASRPKRRLFSSKDTLDLQALSRAKKTVSSRSTQKLGDFKDTTERKFRCKLLTDKQYTLTSTSYFINFLLILTPFAEEKQKFLSDNNNSEVLPSHTDTLQPRERFPVVKFVCGSVLSTLSIFTVLLGIAWKSYQPPYWLLRIVREMS